MKSLLMGLEVISETSKISEFIMCVMIAQEKSMFKNIVITIRKEEANLPKNNNEFIKMFNLRGTYYHLFFIIGVKKVKLDEQLLSYFYTIMESLDELYIGYLVQSLCNEGQIAGNLQNFINEYLGDQ